MKCLHKSNDFFYSSSKTYFFLTSHRLAIIDSSIVNVPAHILHNCPGE